MHSRNPTNPLIQTWCYEPVGAYDVRPRCKCLLRLLAARKHSHSYGFPHSMGQHSHPSYNLYDVAQTHRISQCATIVFIRNAGLGLQRSSSWVTYATQETLLGCSKWQIAKKKNNNNIRLLEQFHHQKKANQHMGRLRFRRIRGVNGNQSGHVDTSWRCREYIHNANEELADRAWGRCHLVTALGVHAKIQRDFHRLVELGSGLFLLSSKPPATFSHGTVLCAILRAQTKRELCMKQRARHGPQSTPPYTSCPDSSRSSRCTGLFEAHKFIPMPSKKGPKRDLMPGTRSLAC